MRSPLSVSFVGRYDLRDRGQVGRGGIVLVPSILVMLTAIAPSVLLVIAQGRSLWFVVGFVALLYGIFLVVINYAFFKRSFGSSRQNRDTGGSEER